MWPDVLVLARVPYTLSFCLWAIKLPIPFPGQQWCAVPPSCSHTWRPELPVNSTSLLSASPLSECATCCAWAKHRPYDAVTISTVRRISFYHSKCANRWVTAPMGAWGEAWRGTLARSPSIAVRPNCLPIAAGSVVLQSQMRALFWGSAAHDAGWHAWRRFGAADGDTLGPPCLPGYARLSP